MKAQAEFINNEIKSIISKPTVTMCKDGTPIEYKNTENIRKIKSREVGAVSSYLIMYVASKGGAKSSLEKFSSGDFLQFLSLYKIFS